MDYSFGDTEQQQQYYDQNGYIQSGHVVSYPSDQVSVSAGVPPTINYPPSMNVSQQAGHPYQYQTQEHAYAQKPIYVDQGQLAPSYPYTTSASPGGAISPSDVFGQSPPTPYAISPGLGHPSLGTPISTPSLGSSYDPHRADYFSHVGADTAAMGPPDLPMSDREPSPGSKKKRGRPKSEGNGDDDKKDPKDFERPRLPHNEVERKYRESLNLGFEKLRAAVPTLPKLDAGAASIAQKQSKAAVLTAAFDYIKCLEGENERLQEENRQLRIKTGDFGEGESSKRGSGRRK